MKSRRPYRYAGVVLLELIILLPILAVFMGIVIWGLRAQISLERRIMLQANRQAVMRSVLNQLRADCLEAERVVFEDPLARVQTHPKLADVIIARLRGLPDPAAPVIPAQDIPVWIMRLDRPGGSVRYRLHDLRPGGDPNAGGGREWHIPQILYREDGEGGLREWRLAGQTLACTPSAHSRSRAIDVRFASRLCDEAGLESYHVFETTLLAGGSLDATKP